MQWREISWRIGQTSSTEVIKEKNYLYETVFHNTLDIFQYFMSHKKYLHRKQD